MKSENQTLTLEETLTLARNVPVQDWKWGRNSSDQYSNLKYNKSNGVRITLRKRTEGFFRKTSLGSIRLHVSEPYLEVNYDSQEALAIYENLTREKDELARSEAKQNLRKLGLSAERCEEILGGKR